MTRSPRLLIAATFVVAALGIARTTWAACNVIPDPTVQLLTAPAASGPAQVLQAALVEENARFGNMVLHKGALGRISRFLLSPENKKPILIAADRRCVPDKALPAFQIDPPRGLVAAMIITPAKGRPVAVLATGAEGGDLSCAAMTKLSGEEQQLMLAGCKDGGVAPVKSQPNVMQLTLPTATAVPDARATKIVLLRGGSVAEVVNTLRRLAATDCESLCGEAAPEASVGACIEKIYAPTELSPAKLVVYATQDMVKCTLTNTPSPIPWNTFVEQCQDGAGWASPMPSCQNPPTASTLTMWEDDCHGVYVPFKYDALLGTTPDKWERQVQGQTALAPKNGPAADRLWIPGAEFVGTLTEADVTGTGTGFVSDPRRAQLDVWFPTDQEFGVRGIVDKPASILHVVPRLPVTLLCANKPDEACMGVPTVPSLDATRCACRDRYAPDCQCEPTVPARYFQCSVSNMPCTRHAHCNPDELCNKQPSCQQEGEVWKKGGANPSSGTPCWHDGHCTGAKAQCGFLLFDMRDLREPGKAEVILDAKLSAAGTRKRRGVCEDTGKAGKPVRKACSNASSGPSCASDEGDCSEYVLEALGGRKVAP